MSPSCMDPRDDRLCDPWEAPVSIVFTVPLPGVGTKTEDGVMPSTLSWCVSDLFSWKAPWLSSRLVGKGKDSGFGKKRVGIPWKGLHEWKQQGGPRVQRCVLGPGGPGPLHACWC